MAKPKIEYPFSLQIIRSIFPLLEKVAPSLAINWAVRLFLTPFNFGFTPSEKQHLSKFKANDVQLRSFTVRVYEVGNGPTIIFLHGWAGRGMQFYKLALSLADEGYRCILIDGPAHGHSKGKRTNIFEFETVFNEIKDQQNDLVAVVGHSLGAATISLAISEGSDVPAFISLGAPVVAKDILSEFADKLNITAHTVNGIRAKAVSEFSRTFESVAMESTFKQVHCPVLALHGEDDLDVPVYHLDVLKGINPNIEIMRFTGIGHRRILKDERVIVKMKNWLKELE